MIFEKRTWSNIGDDGAAKVVESLLKNDTLSSLDLCGICGGNGMIQTVMENDE